jgi:hypothetical protein
MHTMDARVNLSKPFLLALGLSQEHADQVLNGQLDIEEVKLCSGKFAQMLRRAAVNNPSAAASVLGQVGVGKEYMDLIEMSTDEDAVVRAINNIGVSQVIESKCGMVNPLTSLKRSKDGTRENMDRILAYTSLGFTSNMSASDRANFYRQVASGRHPCGVIVERLERTSLDVLEHGVLVVPTEEGKVVDDGLMIKLIEGGDDAGFYVYKNNHWYWATPTETPVRFQSSAFDVDSEKRLVTAPPSARFVYQYARDEMQAFSTIAGKFVQECNRSTKGLEKEVEWTRELKEKCFSALMAQRMSNEMRARVLALDQRWAGCKKRAKAYLVNQKNLDRSERSKNVVDVSAKYEFIKRHAIGDTRYPEKERDLVKVVDTIERAMEYILTTLDKEAGDVEDDEPSDNAKDGETETAKEGNMGEGKQEESNSQTKAGKSQEGAGDQQQEREDQQQGTDDQQQEREDQQQGTEDQQQEREDQQQEAGDNQTEIEDENAAKPDQAGDHEEAGGIQNEKDLEGVGTQKRRLALGTDSTPKRVFLGLIGDVKESYPQLRVWENGVAKDYNYDIVKPKDPDNWAVLIYEEGENPDTFDSAKRWKRTLNLRNTKDTVRMLTKEKTEFVL